MFFYSSSSLANSDDREPLTQNNAPMVRREMPEDSIANHYSNDPFHKNWRDSLDKKTKKEILAEYAKRRPSDASIDSLEVKKYVFKNFYLVMKILRLGSGWCCIT